MTPTGASGSPELAEAILEFWFGGALDDPAALEARVPRWFSADPELDEEVRRRFSDLPDRALDRSLDGWREHPRAAVALILVLDQFPRNLWRGDARAYAFDARALEVALGWIEAGHDQRVPPALAAFGYMPLEHAEDIAAQDRCVERFDALAGRADDSVREVFDRFCEYARSHRRIVARFGRFPHRNALLGRMSTEEERAWLEAGGETFGS